MKRLFIEYPKCSTCQKAKKWLESSKIEFEDRHIVEQNPNEKELREWIQRSGFEIKKWFNTSGLKYKELNLKDRLLTMTDEEKIALLASDGMLVKRPVLVTEKGVCPGFKEDVWKSII
ncbi:MAG: arsenate reductase family protein [Clostridia bacterium]|nr:arsenate reductase family protein [Clostridia bacterium]